MKGWVLFAAVFIVTQFRCCKFMNIKRKWSKHSQHKPLSKEEDTKQKLGGDWSNIPTNMAELILSHLSRADFYRFGEVCSSWRHVVAESILYRSTSPLPSMPLLLIYQLNILNGMKAGFFSLKEQKVYHPKTPLFRRNVHCLGSIEGWLIMVDVNQNSDQHKSSSTSTSASTSANHQSPSFLFWNPISDARVMLPSNLDIPFPVKWHKLFSKVKASSGPDCPDCLVVGLFSGKHHIAFCRPNDNAWSIISIKNDDMNIVFYDIELLHGKCYVLTETKYGKINSILVYDLQVPSHPQAKTLIMLQNQSHYSPRECTWRVLGNRNLNLQNHMFYYLASDPASGDLYLTFMIADIAIYHHPSGPTKYISSPIEKEFIVYKLDLSNEPQLVEVPSLSDGILFLSHKGSKIVPSSALTGPEDLIRGNNIYFVHAYPYKKSPPLTTQIVKFCMTNRRISHIPLQNLELDPEHACLWFMPTLW